MSHKIQIERLHELFDVRADGALVRKIARPGPCWVGTVAGSVSGNGYVELTVDSVPVKAHRVVWAMTNGRWPEDQIDHINGIRTDNRPENLREATSHQNALNRRASTRSTTGLLGAFRHGRKFIARLTFRGAKISFGCFATAEEAHQAYLAGKARLMQGGVL